MSCVKDWGEKLKQKVSFKRFFTCNKKEEKFTLFGCGFGKILGNERGEKIG